MDLIGRLKIHFFLFVLFCFCTANSEPLPTSVTADTVKTYLGEHPEFLDSYIQQNINSNTIEQWMSKKSPISSPSSSSSQVQQQRKTSPSAQLPPPPPTPPPRPSSSLSSSVSMP